jgi:hypothetical protein
MSSRIVVVGSMVRTETPAGASLCRRAATSTPTVGVHIATVNTIAVESPLRATHSVVGAMTLEFPSPISVTTAATSRTRIGTPAASPIVVCASAQTNEQPR